jgi:hypothetical protein
MIPPAFCMWRFAIWAPPKAPFDHPQSSLNPQGTVAPPWLPPAVGGFAEATAGASMIARTLATTAARQSAVAFLPADALPFIASTSPSLTGSPPQTPA